MKVLLRGPIDPGRVSISPVASRKKQSARREIDVDAAWRRYREAARRDGVSVWDADIYRLEDFTRSRGGLHMELSVIAVKEIFASLAVPGEIRRGPDYWPKNLFVAGLLKTHDGLFVFGERASTTSGDQRVDLVGGALSRSEHTVESGRDIVAALHREFEEELNLATAMIRHTCLIGMVLTGKYSIGLIFSSMLRVTEGELRARFERRANDELASITCVGAPQMGGFLRAGAGHLPLVGELLGAG